MRTGGVISLECVYQALVLLSLDSVTSDPVHFTGWLNGLNGLCSLARVARHTPLISLLAIL